MREAAASTCVGGAALICGLPRSLGWAEPDRWYAVEDGPCAPIVPPDPTCAGGQVRAGIAACLEAFDSCYALDSGEYCGVLR